MSRPVEVRAITVAADPREGLWPHRFEVTLTMSVAAESELEAAAWALALLEDQT